MIFLITLKQRQWLNNLVFFVKYTRPERTAVRAHTYVHYLHANIVHGF